MKLKWKSRPIADPFYGRVSRWEAFSPDGVKVGEVVLTGRPGVDHYPWEWNTSHGTGVVDTLFWGKAHVVDALKAT